MLDLTRHSLSCVHTHSARIALALLGSSFAALPSVSAQAAALDAPAQCPITGLQGNVFHGAKALAANTMRSFGVAYHGGGDREAARPAADEQGALPLDLSVLRDNAGLANPYGTRFDYAQAFSALDLKAVKKDIAEVLTTSQEWWPADYGSYAGLMIRLAWHSAGTYRSTDGRGGAAQGIIRLNPVGMWPDNGNLDKARRLLWPVKQKYGRALSWADLIILSGNVAFEISGFQTMGFGGGRADVFEPQVVDWGPESQMLDSRRFDGDELQGDLAAAVMGLIYVNPEGPNGEPNPLVSAQRIRITFGRMGMNDEETVALVGGGHTLGKMHGAAPGDSVGADPSTAPLSAQGLGWKNGYGSGKGDDAITSGIEGAWTYTPPSGRTTTSPT